MAVRRVADQDHARELAVANGHLLVDAERRILISHGLGAVVVDLPRREHLDADDLELGRLHGALVGRPPAVGDRCRENLALFEERRDQPVTDTAVLDALTDREDVGIRRLHVVVHDDAAFDGQAGLSPEIDIRPDPGGDDDEVRVDMLATREFHAFCPPPPADRRRALPQEHADTELLHLRRQEAAACGIELALDERAHQMDDGHAAALHLQAARGLEPEQAAADDDGFRVGTRSFQERARIVERAEGEDAFLVEPLDGRHPRRTARCQQQCVVRRDAPVVARHRLADRVDIDDPDADAKVDLVASIPLERVDGDVFGALLSGEHGRQHHPVVIDVRLVAEHRDPEHRRVFEDLFDAGHACHAVPDDNEPFHREPLARVSAPARAPRGRMGIVEPRHDLMSDKLFLTAP